MKTLYFFLFYFACSTPLIRRELVEELKKNAPFQVYEVEENRFKDWTAQEAKERLGLRNRIKGRKPKSKEELKIQINDSYDFRKAHPECKSPVRDQGKCNSDYAFTATTCFQERWCVKTGGKEKPLFSVQQDISCNDQDIGCQFGQDFNVWHYFCNEGVVEESCFPYTSQNGEVEKCIHECKDGKPWKKYYSTYAEMYENIPSIMKEVRENGPVTCTYELFEDFLSYKGGIYRYHSGSYTGDKFAIILGYGSEDGINYWICQNSWGSDWGESGYFRIEMGTCYIDSDCFGAVPDFSKSKSQ